MGVWGNGCGGNAGVVGWWASSDGCASLGGNDGDDDDGVSL